MFETQRNSIEVSAFTLEGKTLSGHRGRYAIATQIHAQPGVNIYTGTETATGVSVWIKEYYSFWWTASDIQQIEVALEQLETIDFRSGGVQDFRLLIPQDVFASVKDQRCYLVLRPPHHPGRSLKNYLEAQGSLSAATVRYLLSQVLQSLWFLHGQMIDFADGQMQKGTAHGNLSLESLVIVPESTAWNAQFQVYLQDLELWEGVVRSMTSTIAPRSLNEQKQQDLRALGTIAAQLLLGELNPPEHWNAIEDPRWNEITDQSLKQFIQQLMELESPAFSGAKAARKQLLSLPAVVESSPNESEIQDELASIELGQADRPPLYFKIAFALTICGLIANLSLLWANGGVLETPKFEFNNLIQNKR
ncbi:MAG: hypothetical protein KME18_01490 [Phormidium tanganyikae FI6-MK23]|jgi:hypothetical protein|nr:hypothetical protein [Phormidium tanganyikae FI6-MK23]